MSPGRTLFSSPALRLGLLLLLLLLGVALLPAPAARADIVRLRTGETIKGRPIQERSNENFLTVEDYLTGALRRFDWKAVDPADRDRLQQQWMWVSTEQAIIDGVRLVVRLTGGGTEEIYGVVEKENDTTIFLRRQGDLLEVPKAMVDSLDEEPLDVRQVYSPQQLFTQLVEKMKKEGADFDDLDARQHWRLAEWAFLVGDLEAAETHYAAAAADEEFLKKELASQRRARVKSLLQDRAALQTLKAARMKLQMHLFRRVREILDGFKETHPDASEAVLEQVENLRKQLTEARSKYFITVARREFVKIVEALIEDKVREKDIQMTDVTSWSRKELPDSVFEKLAEKYMKRYDDVTPEEARTFWDRRLEARRKPRWRKATYGAGTFIVDPPKIKPPKRRSGGGNRRPSRKGGGAAPRIKIPPPPKRDSWWAKAKPRERVQWVLSYFAERSELFELGERSYRPCLLCHGVGLLSMQLQTGDTLWYLCPRCGGAQQDVIVKFR
ncbi:MAG: hypothetical protein ACC662_07605 [Planctomycetota bacterium]